MKKLSQHAKILLCSQKRYELK